MSKKIILLILSITVVIAILAGTSYAVLFKTNETDEQVYTTLELRMKCGVGKCGRCNIGSKYVCKDGPVFRFDEIDELPNEY